MSAIAEVYKTEGNEAYLKEDYSNAIYFYTEGIKVNCKDQDLKAKLYSNRAYANLRFGETICTFANTDVARWGGGGIVCLKFGTERHVFKNVMMTKYSIYIITELLISSGNYLRTV